MSVPVMSERLGQAVHLGKTPASPPRGVRFGELRPALAKAGVLPAVPAVFGHGNDFAGGNWLMLANGPDQTVRPDWTAARQGAGDCTIAQAMHDEMEAASNAGRPIPRFDGTRAIEIYSQLGGYDPVSGANDNGLNLQDVIAHRQTTGITDLAGQVHKLGPAVSLDPGNLQELWEAAWLFENVDLGVQLTQANIDQFDRGEPWNPQPGSPDLGGHAIPFVGRPDAGHGAAITWAVRHPFTVAFLAGQVDEAHCAIDPSRYNAVTGRTAERYLDADLEKFVLLLARAKTAGR